MSQKWFQTKTFLLNIFHIDWKFFSVVFAEFGTSTPPPWCQSQCQSWWPCLLKENCQRCLLWPFAVATPFRDWWIDCGAAASVSVPWAKVSRLRVGIPAMASALGATIVAILQGALGAGGPGSSSDSHTAVTPLETQQHSPVHGPLIGSDKMTLCKVQQFCRETTWLCQTFLNDSS